MPSKLMEHYSTDPAIKFSIDRKPFNRTANHSWMSYAYTPTEIVITPSGYNNNKDRSKLTF